MLNTRLVILTIGMLILNSCSVGTDSIIPIFSDNVEHRTHTLEMIYLDQKNNGSDITSREEAHSGFNFLMKISRNDGEPMLYNDSKNLAEYTQLHQELAFEGEGQFYYVDDQGTMHHPVLVNLEHDFGLTTSIALYVVFESLPDQDELTIFYEDLQFNTGISRFQFRNLKSPII